MSRLTGVPFYPADPSNYSRGRERAIRYITIHHSAGYEDTLRYLWANPARNGSSHFWVGNKAGQIEQYVDTANTAWTNGNWNSNNESITIEVRGDWRGFYDGQTLNNLRDLIYKILKVHPGLGITYHKDVSSSITLCPADLKDKGYARAKYDEAIAMLAPPKPPTPTPTPITYRAITPKRIILTRTANLWDFNFSSWANAKAVKEYGQGSIIDVVAIAKNALGGEYYMTAYSYNNGAVRATNGFNVVDAKDYVAPPPTPTTPPVVPTPELTFVPLENPRKLRTTRELFVVDLETLKTTGDPIAKGTDIDIVDKATARDNKLYFRSKWAQTNAKKWGVPADSMEELPTAPEVPVEPTPEPPIDVDPTTPGNGDVEARLSALEAIVKAIVDFFTSIFNNFPKIGGSK